MTELQEVADEEYEQLPERVCAIDVAKPSGKVCTGAVPGSAWGSTAGTVWRDRSGDQHVRIGNCPWNRHQAERRPRREARTSCTSSTANAIACSSSRSDRSATRSINARRSARAASRSEPAR